MNTAKNAPNVARISEILSKNTGGSINLLYIFRV
jgi:hypothetical protein